MGHQTARTPNKTQPYSSQDGMRILCTKTAAITYYNISEIKAHPNWREQSVPRHHSPSWRGCPGWMVARSKSVYSIVFSSCRRLYVSPLARLGSALRATDWTSSKKVPCCILKTEGVGLSAPLIASGTEIVLFMETVQRVHAARSAMSSLQELITFN